MDHRQEPAIPSGSPPGVTKPGPASARPQQAPSLRMRDVRLYMACDSLSEILIFLMVIFSPWAFGTTQPWSIWTMNAAGYLLAALLGVKTAIRKWRGYRPPKWGEES